jgi:hypothetical protein
VNKSETHAEFVESRSRSFTNLWSVAEDYRVESGMVIVPVIKGAALYWPQFIYFEGGNLEGVNNYMPMSRPELPAEFSKIVGGNEEDILTFVRRYGLLGYHRAWGFYELPGALGYDRTAKGDPVPWILAHAATVKLVLELAQALENPDQLKIAIEKLKTGSGDVLTYKAMSRSSAYPSDVQTRFDNLRESALYVIASTLNENLGGVSRELIIEYDKQKRQRGLTSVFTPRNLLDCIYWHLTDAVIGGTIRTCGNQKCRRFFVATHRRMQYCPPSMGQVGVSRCMDAAKHQPRTGTAKRGKGKALKRKGGS